MIRRVAILSAALLLLVVTAASQDSAQKKNTRPAEEKPAASPSAKKPVYFYRFDGPERFTVRTIMLQHDENGRGLITFHWGDVEDTETLPIDISGDALDRLKSHWRELDFLNSTENYQYEKDYSHLGSTTLRMNRDGKDRTSTFNWTNVPDAKGLMELYRQLANQHIWVFEMDISRQNQPLETPRLMIKLDGMVRRNGVADPVRLLPYLEDVADDERIPLIARNQATRITKTIEKRLAKSRTKESEIPSEKLNQ